MPRSGGALKDPTFAKGVDRDDVRRGSELLGIELGEHIDNVIQAMRGIAGELGLRGGEIAASSGGGSAPG